MTTEAGRIIGLSVRAKLCDGGPQMKTPPMVLEAFLASSFALTRRF
jgi:hypothetical protein